MIQITKGDSIGKRYRLLEEIGFGGMSIVFKALDKEEDREVAVKFLKKDDSTYFDDLIRFKREIETLSKLHHPNIIKVYESGEYSGVPYIVMEILQGDGLDTLLEKGKVFKEHEAVAVIRQIAEALHYVHGHGIIHRDIKPENIMLVKDKENNKVKLLDFGISRLLKSRHFASDEDRFGSYGFMSPEAIGIIRKQMDERSDLYSVGVNLYLMLTGSFPIADKSTKRLLQKKVAIVPARPSKLKENISPFIDEIVLKLMEKEPSQRYQSARGLIYDLERFEEGVKDFPAGTKDQLVKLSFQTQLIGREEELNTLKKLFDSVQYESGSICLISGEPGIGKSRLAEEMREYAYKQGGLFIWGRCFDQENKIPYQAFRDAINGYIRFLGRLDSIDRDYEVKRIKGILGELGEIIIRMNSAMKSILGEVSKLVQLDPERENRRFLMVGANFFCSLGSKDQPCVLFLDDLQWADEGSLSLLEEMASVIKKHNVLVIGTFRHNEVGSSHSLTRIVDLSKEKEYPLCRIHLDPFEYNNMYKIIGAILGEEEDKRGKLTQYILEKSKGNTFFGIEILREMVVEKGVEWKEGSWDVDWQKIQAMQVSQNMIEFILRRIGELPEDMKNIICTGSVLGREFDINILSQVLEVSREKVVEKLDDGIKMQFLEMSRLKGNVLFVHDRVKDAFYQTLGERRRKALHLRSAEVLEQIDKDKYLFDITHHYAESGDEEKTLLYALPAAEKAKENYANDEAIKYFKLAIKLLEEKGLAKSDDWIKANEGLIDVYLTVAQNDDAIKISEEILSYKKTNLEKARIYGKIGLAYFKKGNYEKGEMNFGQGLFYLGERIPLTRREVYFDLMKNLLIHLFINLFPILPYFRKGRIVKKEDIEKIRIFMHLTFMYGFCDIYKGILTSIKMFNISELKIGESQELGITTTSYACVLSVASLFRRSLKYHKKAISINDNINYQWGLAYAYQFLGIYHYLKGELERSNDIHNKSLIMYKQIGDLWEMAINYNMLGHIKRYCGDYAESINNFLEYLEISKKIKDQYGISSAFSYLGLSYIETGEFKKAEKLFEQSLQISEEKNIQYNMCFGNIHLGYLMIESGKFNEAIKYLEKAKIIYENNKLLQDWTSIVYHHLTDAYIEDFKQRQKSLSLIDKKKYFKKINKNSKRAMKKLKSWANHYGAAMRVYAKYFSLIGKEKKAEYYFIKSMEHNKRINRPYELGRTYYEYGKYFELIRKKDESLKLYQKAYNIFKKIHSKHYIEKLKKCNYSQIF